MLSENRHMIPASGRLTECAAGCISMFFDENVGLASELEEGAEV